MRKTLNIVAPEKHETPCFKLEIAHNSYMVSQVDIWQRFVRDITPLKTTRQHTGVTVISPSRTTHSKKIQPPFSVPRMDRLLRQLITKKRQSDKTFDFHGFTVDTVQHTLDTFLSHCPPSIRTLCVITGKGTRTLEQFVHQYLDSTRLIVTYVHHRPTASFYVYIKKHRS